ncbi:MAG TPA: ATP-binding protein [Polyangia bacterium]|jgi:PAS domain S-box-containing protein
MADRTAELEATLARIQAERDTLAAKWEEARHHMLAVEGAPVAMMCVSAVKGRYLFVNDQFARMAGQAREALLARDPYEIWLEVTHPDEVEEERALLGRVAKGEMEGFQFDKRFVSKQGEARWVRASLRAARDAQGRLESIMVTFEDIHDQRAAEQAREQLETQLRQAEKLGTVGKLVGGIAHDFNNRLAIIMGYGDLLRSGLPADNPLSHHATMVMESAKGAAQLTRQLLAYGRRQVLKPVAFDLNEMVERMRRLLRTVVDDRIELAVALHARTQIIADPGQIEQVILNLALNARDAMAGGGQLTLTTSDGPGDVVALAVSDTGTGIPTEVLPHIFEPFFTTKEPGHGTGLGLAMVQGIVHQSRGSMHVDSSPGRGTTFTIHLPRARRPTLENIPLAEVALPANTSYETVLVCDDDDVVRELLVGILKMRGYSILTARNGRHALEVAAAQDGPIHLLLTDVAMPELGGIELATALRKLRPALKVLYISGHTEHADLLSKPLGRDTHFLPKPFLPRDLTHAVFTILEGQARPGRRA